MGDYRDKDVTDLEPEKIVNLVRLRLRQFPSVQLFQRRVAGERGLRLILRTWLVDFEVEGAEPDAG